MVLRELATSVNRPARTGSLLRPQGVATYRGDQTDSARTAIRCGNVEIELSLAHEQYRVSACQDYGFRSGASDFGKNHREKSFSEIP
jgi:hypothetical protein